VARVSQVIVLVEDERHQRFVRAYLQQLSFTPHDIRLEPLPSGRGSGEAWVRTRYASAVRAYRARAARAQTALVVAIDADTGEGARRARQLEESLGAEGETDFRHAAGVEDQIATAAETLFEWVRLNAVIPQHCLPSLRAAIPELRRLETE
jgi:hypothetical protein